MNRHWITGTVAAALALLAGCGPARESGSTGSEQPPLAGARIGGPFTLTDQDGKTVRWDDFKGKYRLVYFGYSYCPDVCPVDLQRIMQAYRMLEKNAPAKACSRPMCPPSIRASSA